ncbi:unnamed protein product [Rotaria magnacalcarata]|uniref:HAT C-terminal dimerisation domain-containing protein n=1 Tax=Rotaria magnacalcarata TaxID=392030 RepID=A0A816TNT9_9BILA|nr:unnamed protein product [Rotaria magnacalcarata]CAF4040950.1 unnamed protein product [Rotaria magnacalcarata]
MDNKKHRDNLKLLKENTTFTIQTEVNHNPSKADSSSSNISKVTLASRTKKFSFSDQVTRAEALWAINASRHGYSYLSCNESGDLFKKMFPDSNIAQTFNMETKILSYVISHGLGPFFHRNLVEDIRQCERFVLCSDEQKNCQNNKQLDIIFKYWSVKNQRVVTRYYKSILLGHAPAHVIRDHIINSFRTDGIDIKRLLMIGRDNPNVNKTIEKLIDEEMKKVGGELLKLGSCHIHVVHNTFKSGTTTSHWYIEDFCIDVWSWFRHSLARKEDFIKISEELNETVEKNILYFVCTRWVLLGKVVNRILTQWEILNEYFLVYLPENDKTKIKENKKYNSIKSYLSSHVSRTRLLFISYLCRVVFDKFLTLFQKTGSMIHALYEELSNLYRTVLLSFLTSEYIGNKQGNDLLLIDHKLSEKQMNDKQMEIGEETRKSLALLSKEEKETFFRDVRNIFQSIASYLKLNLPLNNLFLRDLKILGPSYRSDTQGIDTIIRIGRFIPGLLSSNEIDLLSDEWLMYSIETIDDSWIIKRKYNGLDGQEYIEHHEVDFYWNKVLSIVQINGYPKYPILSKLVKNILIISHGNADVERGFSANTNVLTKDRTLLSEKSINGLRAIYDGVEFLGAGSVHKVQVSTDMIRAVQKSAASYKEELLKMKALTASQQKESELLQPAELEKKKLIEEEQELMIKYKKLQSKHKTAELLIDEGNQRMENSLKNGDFTDIHAAYTLNKSGIEKMKAIDEEMTKIMDDVSAIQQKRAHAEREQSRKKRKLTVEPVLIQDENIYCD